MPSTVKVRIKAARNLASIKPTTISPPIRTSTHHHHGKSQTQSNLPPTTHVTVTLGGHSAVAEYDEDELLLSTDHRRDGSADGHHHNRTGSKFQWQSMLGTTDENNSTPGSSFDQQQHQQTGGNIHGGTTNSARTSRCYSAQTRTVHHSTNPTYNEEFRFEVADDTLLQDEPLLFHVWDIGDVSTSTSSNNTPPRMSSKKSNGSIGLVYIDLNPLLMRSANEDTEDKNEKNDDNDDHQQQQQQVNTPNTTRIERSGSVGSSSGGELGNNTGGNVNVKEGLGVIDGWFPLYDTLGGVRGELCLSIKLTFIGDKNPFRDSSAGVQLFPFSTLDPNSGYIIAHVFGFVEELVVADDPEFEWSDNFNQARTSHETRQTLMYLLDAKVRRRMCKKVLEIGGNAVLAYRLLFDMEGDSGLVARTFGTCVLIQRKEMVQLAAKDGTNANSSSRVPKLLSSTSSNVVTDPQHHDVVESPHKETLARNTGMVMTLVNEAARQKEDAQEVQLLTMTEFGSRVRVRIGGLVTARSVKYLGKLASKLSDQETRDGWWSELRDEIRSHARTLCCTHVIGKLDAVVSCLSVTIMSSSHLTNTSQSHVPPSYRNTNTGYMESSTIHDDVCVLSIIGTAATVRGLPDLAQAQRMWAEFELQQNEIYERVEKNGRQGGRRSYPGDSSPGSVISTTVDTPFSGAVSDTDAGERGDQDAGGDETPAGADIVKGSLRIDDGTTKQIPFSNLSRKDIKEAKMKRNAQRLERRLRRMGVGRNSKKGGKRSHNISAKNKGSIDKSSFVSNVLLRARLAKPCSYCHVPYHHRLAPFTNMKLV